MEGVTTALVFATLFGLLFPQYVRNKPQFYGAFVGVLVIILLSAIGIFARATALAAAVYGFISLIQIAALILIAMSVSGRSLGELKSEFNQALDDIRTGTAPPDPATLTPSPTSTPTQSPTPTPSSPLKPRDPKGPLPFD